MWRVRNLKNKKNKKNKETTGSIGGVSAKDLPKIKSVIKESLITQKYKSLEISRTLEKRKLGVYIVV